MEVVTTNKQYLENIRSLLDQLEQTQEEAIELVSSVCAKAVLNGKLLYFFGTGHSHMICEEPFYRAGGLRLSHIGIRPYAAQRRQQKQRL